jgi:hypothetical protein
VNEVNFALSVARHVLPSSLFTYCLTIPCLGLIAPNSTSWNLLNSEYTDANKSTTCKTTTLQIKLDQIIPIVEWPFVGTHSSLPNKCVESRKNLEWKQIAKS